MLGLGISIVTSSTSGSRSTSIINPFSKRVSDDGGNLENPGCLGIALAELLREPIG